MSGTSVSKVLTAGDTLRAFARRLEAILVAKTCNFLSEPQNVRISGLAPNNNRVPLCNAAYLSYNIRKKVSNFGEAVLEV